MPAFHQIVTCVMHFDPVSKFHSLTGAASAALRALEDAGRKRVEAERRLRELEERARTRWAGSKSPDPAAEIARLRQEVAALKAREGELVERSQREAAAEQRLADELKRRGLLR